MPKMYEISNFELNKPEILAAFKREPRASILMNYFRFKKQKKITSTKLLKTRTSILLKYHWGLKANAC